MLDAGWDRDNLGVVAFIQNNVTQEVLVAGFSGPAFHRTELPEQGLPAPGALLPLLGVAHGLDGQLAFEADPPL